MLVGLASDCPPPTSILQRSKTPTGGELRGEIRRQRGFQKASFYQFPARDHPVWHIYDLNLIMASHPSITYNSMCIFSRMASTGLARVALMGSYHFGDVPCGFMQGGGCTSVCSSTFPAGIIPVAFVVLVPPQRRPKKPPISTKSR